MTGGVFFYATEGKMRVLFIADVDSGDAKG